MTKYTIFVRNWWKVNSSWPGGLEPNPRARKTFIDYAYGEAEAQRICKEWNTTHKPGKLSRKAEYTAGDL